MHEQEEEKEERRWWGGRNGGRGGPSLVKCTLQGLCITCRLQSFTLLFRLLARSRSGPCFYFILFIVALSRRHRL